LKVPAKNDKSLILGHIFLKFPMLMLSERPKTIFPQYFKALRFSW